MTGAITGDIAGSRFEFDNYRAKDFEMFHKKCSFTDDTVMTAAVAKTLLGFDKVSDIEAFKTELVKNMVEVGRRYPNCGYGGRFIGWLFSDGQKPYKSYGNGSAMRVSPVAWYADSLEECEALAKASAEVTHNHPEGIKGAVAAAGAAYIARTTHDMNAVKKYAEKFYRIDFTIDGIRSTYLFNETCMETVPQALQAFFESASFEDAIRTAVSVGGDSDTLAAITGTVAEAYYGMDSETTRMALSYLDEYLLEIAEEFIAKYVK